MPKKIIDISEFRERVQAGRRPRTAVRLATSGEAQVQADARVATFVFSDNSVDRYGDTIDARGWVLDKYMLNPVALFGHDSGSVENVIGRARNVRVQGDRLIGEIEFMEASVNPNAEAVYQMVKGGYLNTVSVGFQPLDWAVSKDKARPLGVDFKKQELLEISIVPIPANPNALVQARAAGIDVDRLGLIAAGAPKMSKKGLYEVSWLAQLLAELDYLEDVVEWEAEGEGDGSGVPQMLADALNQLGAALVAMTVEEVGELLADENGQEPLIMSDDVVGMSMQQKALASLVRMAKAARETKLDVKVHNIDAIDILRQYIEKIAFADQRLPETKAGKVLSASNEAVLRDAHDMITKGCAQIKSLVDANQPDDGELADDQAKQAEAEEASRKRREREAEAHRLRFRIA